MSSSGVIPPYVADIGYRILVKQGHSIAERLATLGYSIDQFVPDGLSKPAPDERQALAEELKQLRGLEVVFSAGRDWSPSEVFRQLRDEGLVEGEFLEIAWAAPDDWRVRPI